MKAIKINRSVDYVRTSHSVELEPIKGLKVEMKVFGSLNQGSSKGLQDVFIHEIDDFDMYTIYFMGEEVNYNELKKYFSTKEKTGLFKKTWKDFESEIEDFVDLEVKKSISKEASNLLLRDLKKLVYDVAVPCLEQSGCLISEGDKPYYSNEIINKGYDTWTCKRLIQMYTKKRSVKIARLENPQRSVSATPCDKIYNEKRINKSYLNMSA